MQLLKSCSLSLNVGHGFPHIVQVFVNNMEIILVPQTHFVLYLRREFGSKSFLFVSFRRKRRGQSPFKKKRRSKVTFNDQPVL